MTDSGGIDSVCEEGLRRERAQTSATLRGAKLGSGALVLGVLAALALVACGGPGGAFEELEELAGIERGTPTLVFVYTDG